MGDSHEIGKLEQGYLALVLAFEYRLSVIAVDACAHHADVTNKRALRIQKYYNARSRKSQQGQFILVKVRMTYFWYTSRGRCFSFSPYFCQYMVPKFFCINYTVLENMQQSVGDNT